MYFSQNGQDKFLNEKVFKNKRGGVFIDIGANDGVTFSNTYFFEKELSWSGICVEPIKAVYDKLSQVRKCISLNCCVASEEGIKEFLEIEGYSEMLSGLVDKYDSKHEERIKRELEQYGGNVKTINITCRTLNKILEEHKLFEIDYCSIDIEGGEMDIISSFDFERFNVKCFSIENNYQDSYLRSFMAQKGYKLLATLDADDIFVKNNKKLFGLF